MGYSIEIRDGYSILTDRIGGCRPATPAEKQFFGEIERLRAELAETTSALAEMVAQFFMEASDGALMHSFMSAEEHAISVLLRSGVAQEVARNRYRIDWNKIDSTLAKEG